MEEIKRKRGRPRKERPPEEKRGRGRPSIYRPEMAEQARKLALLGLSAERIADVMEISRATFFNFARDYPEFLDSLNSGRENADGEVVNALFKKATGYMGKKLVTSSFEGQVTDVKIVNSPVEPDVTAAMFWLTNRQPEKWRRTPPADGGEDTPTPVAITVTVVDARKK